MDNKTKEQLQMQRICYSFDEGSRCHLQEKLCAALRARDRDNFQQALMMGADPNQSGADSDNEYLSVFELCCLRPDMGAYVEDCVNAHCDVNHINVSLGASPINLAAMSGDAANLNALLITGAVKIIDHVYNGKTAFGQLVEGLNNYNFPARIAAIELLVRHKANVNLPNGHGNPPIVTLLRSTDIDYASKHCVVDMLLQQADVRLDSDAETLLMKHFPEIHANLGESTNDQLLNALRCGKEEVFKRGCKIRMESTVGLAEFVLKSTGDDAQANPMKLAIDNRLPRAVEELLRCGAPVGLSGDGYDALCAASSIGQHKIVGLLLAKCAEGPALAASASSAIFAVIPHIGVHVAKHRAANDDYQFCLEHLLRVHDIELHRRHANGNTILHLAVLFKQFALIGHLLRSGARMGVRNEFGTVAIANIHAHILSAYLDECVGESATARPNEKHYEQTLRYDNFKASDDSVMGNDDNEMSAIRYIATKNGLEHLVKHPLITSFMFLKWKRLLPTFYLTFAWYLMFFSALVAHEVNPTFEVKMFVIAGCGFMVLYDAVNLIIAPAQFLRMFVTYTSVSLSVLTFQMLVTTDIENGYGVTVSALVSLVSFIQLYTRIESILCMSMVTVPVKWMMEARRFLGIFILFIIILAPIVALICLMLTKLFGDNDFDHFDSKTAIIVASTWTSPLVYQRVFKPLDADLKCLVHQAKLLYRYEKILARTQHMGCIQILRNLCYNPIVMCHEYLPCSKISVLPKRRNRVRIPTGKLVDNSDCTWIEGCDFKTVYAGQWKHLPCCFGLSLCSSMRRQIVKQVEDILQKREDYMVETTKKRDRYNEHKHQMHFFEETIKAYNVNFETIQKQLEIVLEKKNV